MDLKHYNVIRVCTKVIKYIMTHEEKLGGAYGM